MSWILVIILCLDKRFIEREAYIGEIVVLVCRVKRLTEQHLQM